MKWFAISGSWRNTNDKVKSDIRKVVKKILEEGDGIVTGGALGADYIATQEVIIGGYIKTRIKLYLPIGIIEFCSHYKKRSKEGIITNLQYERIVKQLEIVESNSKENIYDEHGFEFANEESYYYRNSLIIESCDELYAFQVNKSKGTQDAINKAMEMQKKVHLIEYNM